MKISMHTGSTRRWNQRSLFKGWYWERQCTCSSCGFQANMEKDICPRCGAIMDAKEHDSGAKKPANVTSRQGDDHCHAGGNPITCRKAYPLHLILSQSLPEGMQSVPMDR